MRGAKGAGYTKFQTSHQVLPCTGRDGSPLCLLILVVPSRGVSPARGSLSACTDKWELIIQYSINKDKEFLFAFLLFRRVCM